MKINTLLKMAKRKKHCRIYTDIADRQWMQVGGYLYPLDGVPYLDRETLLVMMDVPEEKRDKYWIECESMPEEYRELTADNAEGDQMAERAGLLLTPLYDTLQPVYIGSERNELVLVPEEGFAPLSDMEAEFLLCAREFKGQTYIVVKNGFALIAVISRVVVNYETAIKILSDVEKHIQKDIDAVKAEEEKRNGEQQTI